MADVSMYKNKSQKTKNLKSIFLTFDVGKLFKSKWAKYIKVVIANINLYITRKFKMNIVRSIIFNILNKNVIQLTAGQRKY